MKPIEHIDEIVRDAFGLWITGLFSAISAWNSALSFEEHKDAFFLADRRVAFGGKSQIHRSGG